MKKIISPSLICTDLCNIESEVRDLQKIGCEMLHVDVIDGIFSPDMPLGIGTVKRLREITDMTLDAHLMSVNATPYAELLLEAGVDRLCFQTEYEKRPTILLRKIRAAGVKAGIAISPEVTVESVKHLLPLCDFVLLMRIDAGYAHLPGQIVYPQVNEKLRELARYRKESGHGLEIELDGRVGFDETEELLRLGADTLVSGTRGVFAKGATRQENFERLQKIVREFENEKL